MGKYTEGADSYITMAGDDSLYFSLGDQWGVIKQKYGLTDKDMFEYFNKPVLKDAINSGKMIRFSHNPLEYRTGSLALEWDYIKATLDITDSDLFFKGGFWYVKQ
jgi:hypothetical protein